MNPLLISLQGMLVGLLASVPLGPIGVICIQRTLNGNHMSGFSSGLGAATADTLFAGLAVFSLSFLTSFLNQNQIWFSAIGGIVIITIGFTIFYKRVKRPSQRKQTKSNLFSNYLSIFLLTLTNPAYMLVFLTLFAALGVASDGNETSVNMLLVGGVFVGASCWWLSLTYVVNKLRCKFRLRHLWWINKITGSLVILIGILLILSILIDLGPVTKLLS